MSRCLKDLAPQKGVLSVAQNKDKELRNGCKASACCEARSIKNLTMIDDVTHEVLAIVPERALGGNQLVRILEQLARTRQLPKAIKTDSGKEFCSRAIVNWAHARGLQLFLTESDKPNHNAYIESFNRRFLDECTNDALAHKSGTCQGH